MELREAIAEVRDITRMIEFWDESDLSTEQSPLRQDRAIATILNAVDDGTLIPADQNTHPDDEAVDRFAAAMKVKLAKKRADGRGGWDNPDKCSAEFLSKLLREHVEKGDPLDVGNLAMMLHQRGDHIHPADQCYEVREGYEVDATKPHANDLPGYEFVPLSEALHIRSADDVRREGFRAGIEASADWIESAPRGYPHRAYRDSIRALAEQKDYG